jgi:hypothetical protein
MKVRDLHLVANYAMKPKDPNKTHIKGYMSDPKNVVMDEQVAITLGLKTRDQVRGGIILNLNKKKVVKNGLDPDNLNFDEHFKHFVAGYKDYITGVMSQLDPEYLAQFIPAEPAASTEPEIIVPTPSTGTIGSA